MASAPVVGVQHTEGTFVGEKGVRLYEQTWRPDSSPRAALIIVHGLKDHSGRYARLGEQLARRGFAVHAFDLRGHGNSEGARVWVDEFDDYLGDLDRFVARVRAREGGRPLFLFGHSMGGAIVTLYVTTLQARVDGVVLSGPALKRGSDVSSFLVGTTKLLAGVLPRLAVLRLANENFSRDPHAVAELADDPLVYQGAGPARTAAELLRAIERIQKHLEDVVQPVLVLHGTADKLTNPEGSRELVERARSSDKTLRLYEGLYHDLLHEPERERIAADLCDWLEAHAAAAHAGR
jgi:alpha-beta hydrolase superfamily lysophospholipase